MWSASSNRMLAYAIMAICQCRIALSGSLLSCSKTPSSHAMTISTGTGTASFKARTSAPRLWRARSYKASNAGSAAGVVGGGDAAESRLPLSPWWGSLWSHTGVCKRNVVRQESGDGDREDWAWRPMLPILQSGGHGLCWSSKLLCPRKSPEGLHPRVTGSGGTRVSCEARVRIAPSLPNHLLFSDASCATKLTTCGVVEGRSNVTVEELPVEVDGVEADGVASTNGRRDVSTPKLPVVDWSRSDCFTWNSPPRDWTTAKKSSMSRRTGISRLPHLVPTQQNRRSLVSRFRNHLQRGLACASGFPPRPMRAKMTLNAGDAMMTLQPVKKMKYKPHYPQKLPEMARPCGQAVVALAQNTADFQDRLPSRTQPTMRHRSTKLGETKDEEKFVPRKPKLFTKGK